MLTCFSLKGAIMPCFGSLFPNPDITLDRHDAPVALCATPLFRVILRQSKRKVIRFAAPGASQMLTRWGKAFLPSGTTRPVSGLSRRRKGYPIDQAGSDPASRGPHRSSQNPRGASRRRHPQGAEKSACEAVTALNCAASASSPSSHERPASGATRAPAMKSILSRAAPSASSPAKTSRHSTKLSPRHPKRKEAAVIPVGTHWSRRVHSVVKTHCERCGENERSSFESCMKCLHQADRVHVYDQRRARYTPCFA